MKQIVLAGGKGFLGQCLSVWLAQSGWQVNILSRTQRAGAGIVRVVAWDGEHLDGWASELEGIDVLINLAGRSVDCRYHSRNRRLILDSRVKSTRVLGEAVGRCARPPRVWLNASTATIYRHTLGPAWDESGEIGATPEARDLFSIQVARAWEQAFADAPAPATRKVALRSAMVLGAGRNSVFPVLRRLVRLGLGGPIGGGQQFMSWIHETDFCRAIEWIIEHDGIEGPVNLCAANPVPNGEMMARLRSVCGAPFGLPVPRWLLELGAFVIRTESELVIKSRRVVPGKLLAGGFQFSFPRLSEALKDLEQRLKPALPRFSIESSVPHT